MQKTRKKTVLYFIGAMLLFSVAMIFHVLHYSVENIYVRTAFSIVPHAIYIALLSGWVISVERRIINSQIRRYLVAVGLLMIFWLAVRTAKWRFLDEFDTPGRYLWYSYYISMILIPLFGVFITNYISRPDSYRMPKWLNFLYIPALVLIALVMTNDLHELVFGFDNGLVNYDSDYSYGPLFYLLPAWFVILGFYFVITLIIKSRVPGSRTFQKMPLIIMGCGVAFWTFYSLGLIKCDLTAVDCLLITLLLESAIQSGLIRSNTGYNELFEISTVAAQIADKNYQPCFISAYADDLQEDVMKSAAAKPVDLGKTMLYCEKVSGGYMFWQSDIKQMKKLMKNLEETQGQLNESNDLLKAEIELKEEKARFDEKNRLYDRIAEDVSSQLLKADELLAEVGKNPDKARDYLSRICVLCAYIKRRSNLLLLGEENREITANELTFCLRESLDNLGFIGIMTSLESDCNGLTDVETAVLCYDIFEKITESLLHVMNALLIHIECENGNIKMQLQIGCETHADISEVPEITLESGEISVRVQDEDIIINVLLTEGGAVNV